MVDLRTDDDAVLVPVKVVPGASRTRLQGMLGGRLKVAVAAPPERGKANEALTAFLAKAVGVRRRDVTVVQGETSPEKIVRIAGASPEQVRAALGIGE